MVFNQLKFKLKQFKIRAWQSKGKASIYNMITKINGDYQDFLTDQYIKELTSRINLSSSILDLGAGTGVLSLKLTQLGYKVISLDISKEMLAELSKNCEGLSVSLKQGDIFDIPFQEETFERVITRWVIPHFADWPLIVNEVSRVLKKGGIFVFDMTIKENYTHPNHQYQTPFVKFDYNPMDPSAKNFYASATIDEIKLLACCSSFHVVDIFPNGFFKSNALLYSSLGHQKYNLFKSEFDDFYKNKSVAEFIQWFDLSVTKSLPFDLVNTMTIVLRKV